MQPIAIAETAASEMIMSTTQNDFSVRVLAFLQDRVPASLQPWNEAMLAELAVVEGFWPRLRWSLGGMIALLTAALRLSARSATKQPGGVEVSLVAAYHFLFSAVLIGMTTWQLPQVTESWKYAVPALIMCYALATLPAVLGFGLVLRDEAARVGTVMFTIAHWLVNFEFIRRGLAPHPRFTTLRLVADVVIIIALNRGAVRRAFQHSPITLHLRG
jgi:hypothetical protein